MKKAEIFNQSGIPLSWGNLLPFNAKNSVVDIFDVIEDSNNGDDLVNTINFLDIMENFRLERETDDYVRLVCVDCFGNRTYIKAYK